MLNNVILIISELLILIDKVILYRNKIFMELRVSF